MNMHSKIDLEPDFAVVARYSELLGYKADEAREWRFLPDDPVEQARIHKIEKEERLKTGDRKFAVKRNYPGTLAEVRGRHGNA